MTSDPKDRTLPAETDPLMEEAIACALQNGVISVSLLQKKFTLGFARAARILEAMQDMGLVGTARKAPYPVLLTAEEWEQRKK